VLSVAESVYDGTWSSGPAPQELEDFELMREMHWTWRDLQECPAYVRRFCWDLTLARRDAERAAHEKAQRKPGRGN